MKSLLLVAAATWLFCSVLGWVYITRLEATPAENGGNHPQLFPVGSKLTRKSGLPTLIFFAHPKCPCTRAGLRELSRMLTEAPGKTAAYVVLIKPKDTDEDWTRSDLQDLALSIPNVEVFIDQDEREAHIFGAGTSSLTLLYDELGQLRFSGGITAARGHEGDNTGRDLLTDIILEKTEQYGQTPVFGCPLHKKDCALHSADGGF